MPKVKNVTKAQLQVQLDESLKTIEDYKALHKKANEVLTDLQEDSKILKMKANEYFGANKVSTSYIKYLEQRLEFLNEFRVKKETEYAHEPTQTN